MTIPPAELAALKALCEKATPGPWERAPYGRALETSQWILGSNKNGGMSVRHSGKLQIVRDQTGRSKRLDDDLAFIAAARTAVPRLIAEIDRLAAELERAITDLKSADAMIVWMSGSADFAPGGRAFEGWVTASEWLVGARERWGLTNDDAAVSAFDRALNDVRVVVDLRAELDRARGLLERIVSEGDPGKFLIALDVAKLYLSGARAEERT